jgi:predicted phosphodiesterase
MLRFIGDIHNHQDRYLQLIEGLDQSMQVGDLADDFEFLRDVSPAHKFIGGNHDNYPRMMAWDKGHHLGHYGVHEFPGFGPVFYVRGAASIDWKIKRAYVDWWPEEQLSYGQCLEAIALYEQVKPEVVVSHDCPMFFVPEVTSNQIMVTFGYAPGAMQTTTNAMLDRMYGIHQPKLHVFGHYHKSVDRMVGQTRFVCVAAQKCIDLEYPQ